MKLDTIDKIKKLKLNADKLKTLKARYKEAINNDNIDKYGFGFNRDDRFSVFEVGKVSLDAHTGRYGSSSCYRFESLDNDICSEAFTRVINIHIDFILKEMADYVEGEIDTFKDDLNVEFDSIKKLVDEINKETHETK